MAPVDDDELDLGAVDGVGTSAGRRRWVRPRSALLMETSEPGEHEVLLAQLTPLSEQVVRISRPVDADKLQDAHLPLHQLLTSALRRSSEVWYLVWMAAIDVVEESFQDVPFVSMYVLDVVSICESVLQLSGQLESSPHSYGNLLESTILHKATVTALPAERAETRRALHAAVLQYERRIEAQRRAAVAERTVELERLRASLEEQQRMVDEAWAQRQGVLPSAPQAVMPVTSWDEARDQYRQHRDAGRRFVGDQLGIPGGRVGVLETETGTGENHE